jgi:ribosomal protein RSM22 (predicted rRNA methylase)
MSDYYIQNPDSKTPWSEPWCQIAQLTYFLPLNYLRAQYVMEEAHKTSFFSPQALCLEIGYGLGALTLHLLEIFESVEGYEVSEESRDIFTGVLNHLKLQNFKNLLKPVVQEHHTLCFSYSLTEAISMEDILKAESVLIIEPSTQNDARELQALRQRLIDNGFYAWAPCTHQKKCPLLVHSQKDWCHHRIHVEMPDWFLEIEKHLPFKNKTLTFSYLLMSKRKPAFYKLQKARVIGDILEEKGKSKALICRSEDREFLSLLHRDSKVFPYERGEIVELPSGLEKKGNELRLKIEAGIK